MAIKIFADAKREAAKIIADAKRGADKSIADAARDADTLTADAERDAAKVTAVAAREAAKIIADAEREAGKIMSNAAREATNIIADTEPEAANLEAVAKEMAIRGAKMLQDVRELNPDLDPDTQAIIQGKVKRRARQGCPSGCRELITAALLPNLAVQVEVACADPPTIEQVEATSKLMSDTSFVVSTEDTNAVLHIAAAIAQKHNLTFAVTSTPSAEVERDSWNKSADFAMANDRLTESSMFLLGSTCPEHHVKAITVHLDGDFDALEADPERKRSHIRDVRAKLAAVHGVQPNEVIMFDVARGSEADSYTLRSGILNVEGLEGRSRAVFGRAYLHLEFRRAFIHLSVNRNIFAPEWNRDFRVPANCPVNEKRAGFYYTPPAGWQRFGMKVRGKFEGGDEWLGHVNRPGEWALVYHGTKHKNVENLAKTPLRAGPEMQGLRGYGIYCSPNPVVVAEHTDKLELQGTRYKFMFVCRVNVSAVHRCTEFECPEAKNARYTVHITQNPDIWFANCQNQAYQNIRAYGILVKTIPKP
jgi:vacuolar-type H+-ATPase subunit H